MRASSSHLINLFKKQLLGKDPPLLSLQLVQGIFLLGVSVKFFLIVFLSFISGAQVRVVLLKVANQSLVYHVVSELSDQIQTLIYLGHHLL